MDDDIHAAIANRLTRLEARLMDRAFLYDAPRVYREAIRDVCRELRMELRGRPAVSAAV